ncbi:MAG: flagellar basal body L-ring protein FlgH [Pirellulaceae bacterium]
MSHPNDNSLPVARRYCRAPAGALGLRVAWASFAGLLITSAAWGQNSSLFRPAVMQPPAPASPGGVPAAAPPPATPGLVNPSPLPLNSWTYIAVPPPKKIQLHDVVVVRVDEIDRMQSDGEISRRKTSTYNARLADWIFLRGLEAIKPDPQVDGDQRVQGQLQQQLRATSELEARNALTLTIACEVIDMRPNGNLVLEGHKRITLNEENWEISLSGLCRREDILPTNEILSRNMLDLQIAKRESGQVRAGYRRGWFQRWFDEFDPF